MAKKSSRIIGIFFTGILFIIQQYLGTFYFLQYFVWERLNCSSFQLQVLYLGIKILLVNKKMKQIKLKSKALELFHGILPFISFGAGIYDQFSVDMISWTKRQNLRTSVCLRALVLEKI